MLSEKCFGKNENKCEKNEDENLQLLNFKMFDHKNYITGFLGFLSGRIYNSPLQETHICEVIGHYSRPHQFLNIVSDFGTGV